MRYHKSLDTYRALAALAVVLYHCNAFPAGWVGVHAFFVLSGFLITTILLQARNLEFGRYLAHFYRRRALRILPLYYGFLLVLFIVNAAVSGRMAFDRGWIPLATYTYNLASLRDAVGSQYFGHLWSLCVEEQFYLLWPLAVYFLSPTAFRRFSVALIVAGPLLRWATAAFFLHGGAGPETAAAAVYFGTPSHVDAFATGAFLAVAPAVTREWIAGHSRQVFAGCMSLAAGAAAINVALYVHAGGGGHSHGVFALGFIRKSPDFQQYLWDYSALNVASFGALVFFMHGVAGGSLLENPVLVYLGRISYGIYVWHLPIVRLYERYWPCALFTREWVAWVLSVTVTAVAAASISFFTFEKRFLDLKDRKRTRARVEAAREETETPARIETAGEPAVRVSNT